MPLGLVKVKSDIAEDVGKNHQVLAYGYDLDDTDLTIYLYDPNYADDDAVELHLSIAGDRVPVPLTYTPHRNGLLLLSHAVLVRATADALNVRGLAVFWCARWWRDAAVADARPCRRLRA